MERNRSRWIQIQSGTWKQCYCLTERKWYIRIQDLPLVSRLETESKGGEEERLEPFPVHPQPAWGEGPRPPPASSAISRGISSPHISARSWAAGRHLAGEATATMPKAEGLCGGATGLSL